MFPLPHTGFPVAMICCNRIQSVEANRKIEVAQLAPELIVGVKVKAKAVMD